MGERKSICLDHDGVYCDSTPFKIKMLKDFKGVEVQPHQVRGKYLIEHVFSGDRAAYMDFGAFVYESELGMQMRPVEGAVEYILKLQEEYEVLIVSSRNSRQLATAEKWSRQQNVSVEFIGVGYGVSKLDVLIQRKAVAYVDDDYHKLEDLVKRVDNLFLFSQPHNLNDQIHPLVRRVPNWPVLYEEIRARNI